MGWLWLTLDVAIVIGIAVQVAALVRTVRAIRDERRERREGRRW
jgi:multisubunit Na+/H+ antiporter MnhC subunit